ncbi:MAG TPA: tyrosine-type recombinase/integrase [Methanoregulaceae archaeon]|nr:tyrosine-type recombinase/integrase [Methanoregulaceae archaeon]
MTTPAGQESISHFHTSDETYRRYSTSALSRAVTEGRISQADADLILEFTQELRARSRKITTARVFKITVTLIGVREFLPRPFPECGIKDVYAAREAIETTQKPDGSTRYKQNTQADFVRFMKRFFLWLVDNERSTIPYKKLKEISPPAYRYDVKTEDSIFSREEVHAMLRACQNSRDRAIVSVLYEGALRIGELGTLRWNQVTFTNVNATLKVRFKTEKTRIIPLFMAREYLSAWKNDYPGEPAGDRFVFLTANGGGKRSGRNQLQYAGIAKQIRKIAGRAGIQKHVTPHIFRHSRITHLVQDGTQESMIKLLGWGDPATTMFDKCYNHVGGADVVNEMARVAGVEMGERTKSKILEPRQCPHCGEINGPTRRWCVKCETALTEEDRERVKTVMEQAELLPEFKHLQQQVKDLQDQLIAVKRGIV